ncbi:MAG: DNA translocase FtsK [Dehalococcoidia bacterium]|nr:DNA translocase FtsK [Dehalococcoidia bacterium]
MFWDNLRILALDAWDSLLVFFGPGVFLVGAAFVCLIWVAWKVKWGLLLRYFNQVLGWLSFAAAAFGALSFFKGEGLLRDASLGGYLGKIIAGPSTNGGIAIVGLLILLGTFFIVPRGFIVVTLAILSGMFRGVKYIVKGIILFFVFLYKIFSHIISGVSAFVNFFRKRKPSDIVKSRPEEGDSRRLAVEREGERSRAVTRGIQSMPELRRTDDENPALEVEEDDEVNKSGITTPGKVPPEPVPVITATGWMLPSLELLDVTTDLELRPMDNERRARLIEEALESYGVEARVVQINAGPAVTQFGVEPGWDRRYKEIKEKGPDGNVVIRQEEVSKTRVKVERINSLANDLALALAAPSIRIESPVPGKAMVGIEVPNAIMGVVSLRGVMEGNNYLKLRTKSRLALALGKGAGGEPVVGDLSKMPHLLIAGATGSGKTVCLNAVILCLILNNTPDEVRFIMIDPKRVEMVAFNSIPHLITPVVVDSERAVEILRWLNKEMETRYRKLADAGARNIEAYNKDKPAGFNMPYLVLVVDELADLMMTASGEVEHILCRLAQLARATGIHLVVATQRPSVDVITGLIKANFPTRISFAVTSQVDSRTILDVVGAEKLLGRGDMLYLPTDAVKPKRLQGCFVSDAEIDRVVKVWAGQHRAERVSLKLEDMVKPSQNQGKSVSPEDPLLAEAKLLKEEHKNISASFLQRKLQVGYPRAARLIDLLNQEEENTAAKPEVDGNLQP